MIDPKSFQSCYDLFREYGVSLDTDQYEKLCKYEQMLVEESVRQNVTAVREPEQIWVRHFLDSAMLLQYIPDHATVLDMGTGGGIPAIPLAIMNPSLNVTMLDSELRKIEFCRNVISSLGLDAAAVNGRAEEFARDPIYHEQFDIVVSRAMANGSVLTELSVGFLKTGGKLYAMKGKQYEPETERFASAASVLCCSVNETISYSVCGEQKYLICVQKDSETPLQYPRRYAKIKRSPL
jgi:16S rRNA (guanine527-N7)-methyltransferase